MVVQHNLRAMNSNRMLGITSSSQAKSTEKLSSGYKVNRAADDAAGLSISEKMRRQVRGLTQASLNAQDGISCVQTAEGALAEVQDMLQRMNELCVKASNGTLQTVDRNYIQQEIDALTSEIDRVAGTTTFNETALLDGTFTAKTLHVGAEGNKNWDGGGGLTDQQTIGVNIMSLSFKGVTSATTTVKTFVDAAGGGVFTADGTEKLNVTSQAQAQSSIAVVKTGLQNISTMRSALGAVQNRLEHTIRNLDNVVENTTAAESQIRDTDMATEMVKYSNNNILAQAGQAMLAQSNQANQGVLSLLS